MKLKISEKNYEKLTGDHENQQDAFFVKSYVISLLRLYIYISICSLQQPTTDLSLFSRVKSAAGRISPEILK